MKKIKRLFAFLLTIVMVLGEIAGTGIRANAAGGDLAQGYITAVAATAAITTPALGKTVSKPQYTLTAPTDKGVTVYGDGWLKKGSSGRWIDYKNDVFEEGTYAPICVVRTDAYKLNDGSEKYAYYTVSTSTKLTVGGTAYTAYGDVSSYYNVNSSGWMKFRGPEFKVEIPAGQQAITIETDGNGKASASVTSAAPGDTVTLTATPNSGYVFKNWELVYGDDIIIADNKFMMKYSNVRIRAHFTSAYVEKGTVSKVLGGTTYKDPTIGETIGQPKAFVADPTNRGVGLKDLCWYKYIGDGKYIKCSSSESYEAGTKYKLRATLYSKAYANDQYWNYYRLTENVTLTIYSEEWTKVGTLRDNYESYGYGEVTFEGPEIEAIEDRNLSGTVYYTTAVEAGNIIGLGFDGKLNDLAYRNIPMHYTWQRAEDKEGPWTDIDDSDNRTYQLGADDVGKYIRVSVTADGYVGNVTSSERLVERRENNATPLHPGLSTADPFTSVTVTGTRASQEYVMKTSSVAVTEEEWNALSRSPEKDGDPIVFDSGITAGQNVYISTRYKETGISKAGTNVLQLCIYAGSSSAVNGIVLDKRKVDMTTGDVIELTVRPDPINASAWVGNNWVTWSVVDDKTCLKLYLDPECCISYDKTNPEHSKVNTVYVKAAASDYWASVRVSRNTFYDECRFTIVDENGEVPLTSLSFHGATVHAGETAMLEYKRFPENGKVGDISIVPINPEFPDILFSKGDIGDTVKAVVPASAPEGSYQYTVTYEAYEYGHPTSKNTSLYITIDNSITPVEAVGLSMEEYTARPGDVFNLSAYVCPADAGDGTISWSVSDTETASVDSGKVTVKESAEDGVSFNVIARAGNQIGICTVKVYKEKFVYVTDSFALENGTGAYLPGEAVCISAGVSDNKVFVGWESEDIEQWYSGAPEGSFKMPNKEVIVKAIWEDKYCSVSFNMCGQGAAIAGQTIERGNKASKPEEPKAEGYVFDGWYVDEAYQNRFNFDSSIIEDTVLYAKWIRVYSVSFNNMGHGMAVEEQKVEEGKTATKPAELQEDNYDFLGWYTEEACTNAYDFAAPVTKDLILYAKWEEAVSAMNPIPLITADTKELYLVKGQSFTLPDGKWTSDTPKAVKISKKGTVLTAKKVTDPAKPATITLDGTQRNIKIYVTLPKFADKKVTLKAGEKGRDLSFTYDKHNAVQWMTSAPDVATVSQNGLVNAVAKGKATITAFVNGKAYSCTVSVKEETPVAERTLHLNLTKSKKVSIKGVKTNKAEWSVSDNNIASVKKGKIKAGNKAGTTTVTCKNTDGRIYKIIVTVEDPAIKTGKITAEKGKNKYKIELNKAGDKEKITFNNVVQPVTFRSSAGAKAYVSRDGYIVANGKGKAKLTAKINGVTVSIKVKVNN